MAKRRSRAHLSLVRSAGAPVKRRSRAHLSLVRSAGSPVKRPLEVPPDLATEDPIPVFVIAAAARVGARCVPVLLAARVWIEMNGHGSVTTTAWIAAATKMNIRVVQRAVSRLVGVGMLVRREGGITIPSWSVLCRLVEDEGEDDGGGGRAA